jgi:hypothetical protein
MKNLKRTFYPVGMVEEDLQKVAPKKLSARVNELILKGMAKEKEELMREEYAQMVDLLNNPSRKKIQGVSVTMMMSKKLFEDDGSDDGDIV